ncbi:hypothetical protein [Frankia sp. AgB32]|uniref:hypothetical protein n=1 Tax=Frankia sp. AgB32 TaxID=631119 RepID=UPI00200F14CA|nr:hypothetical protein [Frankia sp. AgB32]MCK9893733.1 hypothetical protein [Frankia sp. AgB32]
MAPAAREDRRYNGPGGQVGYDDRAAWAGPNHPDWPAEPGRANPAAPRERSRPEPHDAPQDRGGRDGYDDRHDSGGYVTGDGYDDGRFGDRDPYDDDRRYDDRYDDSRHLSDRRHGGDRHGDPYGDDQYSENPYGEAPYGDDRRGGDRRGGDRRGDGGWPSDRVDTPVPRRGGGARGARDGYGGREPLAERGPYGETAVYGGARSPAARPHGAGSVGRDRAARDDRAARARRPDGAGRYGAAGGFDTDRVDTPVPFAPQAPRAQPAPRSGPPPRSSDGLLPYIAFVAVVAVLAGAAGYALNHLVGPAHRQRPAPATASATPSAPATPTVTPGPADPGAGGGAAADGGLTALTAQQVAGRLAETGLPLHPTVVYTAATDPDHLLGTVGGYWSRLAFSDSRVGANEVAGAPAGAIERGGAVEVWPDATSAQRRARSLLTVTEQNPLVTEYVYTRGTVVLRVSLVLTEQQAAGYRTGLASISS